MSSHTAHTHHTAAQRLAACVGLAGALALGVAAPALAKPAGPGDDATGAPNSQQGPPSYNSTWPGYTPPGQVAPAPQGPVGIASDRIELVQVGLGALGGAALAGVGTLVLAGAHRRHAPVHA
jgi:hypothetical protein